MADEVDRGPARLRKSSLTAASHHEPAFTPGAGTVVGAPRHWLCLEGATLLAGALIAYTTTNQPWWLIPLTLLIPDISAVGYLGGARLGARLYNVAHVTALPAAAIALGCWQHVPLVAALGLVWLAHIGMDRLLGYGLKYNDSPQHTHLSWKSSRPLVPAAPTPVDTPKRVATVGGVSEDLHAHLLEERGDEVAELHRRATAWFEANGDTSQAIIGTTESARLPDQDGDSSAQARASDTRATRSVRPG